MAEPIARNRSSSDRLGNLGVFVAVVENGSFATAASKLGVTRSAVGKAVLRLEKEVGAQLFQRTTRRLSTTEAGQVYYEHCRRALAEIANAEAAIEKGMHGPTGILRITAPQALGRHYVAPLMAKLARGNRELEVEMSFSDRVVDLVRERFDLAIRIGQLPNSSTLQSRRIGIQRFGMFAAPAYIRRVGQPRSVADLAKHTAITYYASERSSRWNFSDGRGGLQEAPVRRMLSIDDIDAIAAATLAGHGISRLPWWMATPLVERGELVAVLPQTYQEDSDVQVVWPKSRLLPLKTRVAIDALVESAAKVLLPV